MTSQDGALFGGKLTFDRMTSNVAPALAWMDGALFLAFTGQDGRLNVSQFGFRGGAVAPLSDPNLRVTSTILDDSSDSQPALAGFDRDDSVMLAWTGKDSDHLLNLRSASAPSASVPLVFGTKRTFTDEGLGGPALAAIRDELFMAWTGRDLYGNINLARAL